MEWTQTFERHCTCIVRYAWTPMVSWTPVVSILLTPLLSTFSSEGMLSAQSKLRTCGRGLSDCFHTNTCILRPVRTDDLKGESLLLERLR